MSHERIGKAMFPGLFAIAVAAVTHGTCDA
jgi:hypothetical protein